MITQEEFCARFKEHLLKIAGPKDDDGGDVAEYADMTAPTYYADQHQSDSSFGPEEAAETDFSYWEA
jgi:hypothetical protein